MRFGLILAGVTLITLFVIFGVYYFFLKKEPVTVIQPSPLPTMSVQSLPTPLPSPTQTPLPPTASAQPGSATRITPKPSSRSTIGTLTVLQDGTVVNNSSTNGSSNISGTISFTGTAPTGTSIVIVSRRSGTSDSYKTVVDGISASNGASWSWGSASSGVAYDLIAILKGTASNGVGIDYAMSQNYVVTAPAYGQIFSLNAASAPAQPSGTITTTCSNKTASNTWGVTVTFPTVAGTQWYKLQVGSTSEGSDIVNTSLSASSMSPSTTATFTDSVIYYAQFAVANAANPTDAQYSEFSEPQTIKCP